MGTAKTVCFMFQAYQPLGLGKGVMVFCRNSQRHFLSSVFFAHEPERKGSVYLEGGVDRHFGVRVQGICHSACVGMSRKAGVGICADSEESEGTESNGVALGLRRHEM